MISPPLPPIDAFLQTLLTLGNLSCYAIVFPNANNMFVFRAIRASEHGTVESLRPCCVFPRCNFAVACGRVFDADATRRDGTRRGAPIKPVRNEFPISRPLPFSTNSRARCIYVSIPCVRFAAVTVPRGEGGEATATVGAEGIIGLSRIRSWAGSFGAKPDRLTQLGFITGSAASLPANICNT